jgi:ribosomal protein S18 acetylase RimI-like enzyme
VWAESFLGAGVAGRLQARRGELMDTLEGGAGSGVVAVADGAPVGLLTWLVDPEGGAAEIRALAVAEDRRGHGVGRSLLDAGVAALAAAGVRRAWLVTTNDNLAALALYQRAGWRLAALRAGAVDEARRTLKPSIPEVGEHGIPIRDELELETHIEG